MASRLFVVDLDLGLNSAKRFKFEDFSTNPSTDLSNGRVVYFTGSGSDQNHLRVYNGTSWKTLAYTDDVPTISISLDAPDLFSVSGSPADASGTLAFEWNTAAVNGVLAGPATGSTAAIPTFRSLVDADIPVEIARVEDVDTALEAYILLTEKGEPLGVAELDENGYVPAEQLDLSDYVTLTGVETLTNKTFNDYISFTNPSTTPVDGTIGINDTNEDFEITALVGDLKLSASASGKEVVVSDTLNVSNNIKLDGSLYFDYSETEGLPTPKAYINAFYGMGGTELYITSDGNARINANGTSGTASISGYNTSVAAQNNVILDANNGGEYLGSVDPDNQIATIGDINSEGVNLLTGTANQIVVSGDGTGDVTLSLDPDIILGGTAKAKIHFKNASDVQTATLQAESTGDFSIVGDANLVISGTTGEYIGSVGTNNQIATVGTSQTFSNKTIEAVTFNNISTYVYGVETSVGSAAIAFNEDGTLGISSNSGSGPYMGLGGNISITTSNDFTVTAFSGDIVLNAGGGEYLGSVVAGNQIATIGDLEALDAYDITSTQISNWDTAYGWGDHSLEGYLTTAVLSVSNTDGNLVVGVDSENPTIDLAEDIEISGSLTVQGDLTVNGEVTTLNTETLTVEDNIVVLNSNVTGTPSVNAGIEVERGTSDNATIVWNETNDVWTAGISGAEIAIARKFTTTTTGTTHTVTHNLGTSDVTVNCWLAGEQVEANVVVTDANTVTVTTNASVTLKTVVVG
jgi:hypothetical protein